MNVQPVLASCSPDPQPRVARRVPCAASTSRGTTLLIRNHEVRTAPDGGRLGAAAGRGQVRPAAFWQRSGLVRLSFTIALPGRSPGLPTVDTTTSDMRSSRQQAQREGIVQSMNKRRLAWLSIIMAFSLTA